MKNLLIAISLMVSFASQAHELVEHSQEIYNAQINEMEINHELPYDVAGAEIEINKTQDTLKLAIFQKINCPEGMACIALAPAPVIIELPVVNVYTDWCGSTTYEALKDMTPVDGPRQTLTITDYSTMKCKILLPYQSTAVWSTFNPWTNSTVTSTFEGGFLKLLPTFHN